MTTILIIVTALLAAVTVHETAHALALRGLGVHINAAGIGLPIWPILTIKTPWRFNFTLSPWLFGAYVSASEEDNKRLDQMPYRDQAWYLNAGIVANILLAFGILAVDATFRGSWIRAVVFAVATGVVWLTRKFLAAYVIPAAAPLALAAVIYGLVVSWSAGETGMGFAGMGDTVPSDHAQVPLYFAGISIALAAVNMLPLFGLDNGKVVGMILDRWAPEWAIRAYQYVGLALIAAMLLGALGSDLWAIVEAVL